MSQLQLFSRKGVQILKTVPGLLSHVRNKTTSEHLLRQRGGPGPFKTQAQICIETKSHMNFYPVPEGSHQEYHKARNMKWATMLMMSVTFLGITTFIAYKLDCFFLHSLPPRRKISTNSEKIGKLQY
ncbi:uncharacterized protein [Littorina saxatilis]|uniref:Deltamethrin resistance protein prag01 domain-containing protein n=1 Tax=Littorina saxatilis TaxID=31220 RepID=A0AAN9G795_9CAEN